MFLIGITSINNYYIILYLRLDFLLHLDANPFVIA